MPYCIEHFKSYEGECNQCINKLIKDNDEITQLEEEHRRTIYSVTDFRVNYPIYGDKLG